MPNYSISRVITPATSLALVTLDQAKTTLGIALSDTTHDADVQQVIDQVSAGINNYCNRTFVVQTYRDQFREVCNWLKTGEPLRTRQAPIAVDSGGVPVLTVTEDGTALDPSVWEVDLKSGEVYRLSDDGSGAANSWAGSLYLLDYDGGYNPVPDDVTGSALEWINGRWLARGRDPALVREEIPDVIVRFYSPAIAAGATYGASIPAVVRDWLQSYIKYFA
jgi:hypothetical protein